MKQTFPYDAWVLTAALRPKKVSVVRAEKAYGSRAGWLVTKGSGCFSVSYPIGDVHATEAAACQAGIAAATDKDVKYSRLLSENCRRRAWLTARIEKLKQSD